MQSKFHPKVGDRFGKFTLESAATCDANSVWVCRCECGITEDRIPNKLRRSVRVGKTPMCHPCIRKQSSDIHTTHGHMKRGMVSPTWISWDAMRARCTRPAHEAFHHYGGRGITICDRWMKFENFVADMGDRPSRRHSIERIDVNGHYEPENCYWATWAEQGNNKRDNRVVTYQGQPYTVRQLSNKTGIGHSTLIMRLNRGMSPEEAVETPLIVRRCRKCGNKVHGRTPCPTTEGNAS